MKWIIYNILFVISFLGLSGSYYYYLLNKTKLEIQKKYEQKITIITKNLKDETINTVNYVKKEKEREVMSKLTYNVLKDLYSITDSILIKDSYDNKEDIINSKNILNTLKLLTDKYYNEYKILYGNGDRNFLDLKITLYYIQNNKLYEEKIKKIKDQEKYFNDIKDLITYKEKIDISNLNIIKQKYNDNTCMYNSLNHLFQLQFGKELNRDFVYSSIGKKIGDYWNSGLFQITKEGGKWLEDKSFSGGVFYSDFYKLKNTGIISYYSNNYNYITKKIKEDKRIGILERPMYLFDSRPIWKNKKKDIWHAVTIIGFDGNLFSYIDSLDGRIKQLSIENIILGNGIKKIKYPIRFITFNNQKILENKDVIFK